MHTKNRKLMKFWYVPVITLGFIFLSGCSRRDSEELLLTDMSETVMETEADDTEKALESAESVQAEKKSEDIEERTKSQTEVSLSEQVCYVHICGEIKNPGVYRIKTDSRIYQIIEMAGGFTEEAKTDYVNQALPVEDGMKIQIPNKRDSVTAKETETGTDSSSAQGIYRAKRADSISGQEKAENPGSNLVNINTASKQELCTLNGIGESRAKAIIDYRTEHGEFSKPEDIMKVAGIKESSFLKVKEQITVRQE